MRFLETNEIDNLEKDLDNNELPLSLENLDKEIDRLQAIKDKLPSKYSLSIELMSIGEARSIDPFGIANPFKKLKVAIDAQKRYKVAQKRFNSAMRLRAEVDSRIEDYYAVKNIYAKDKYLKCDMSASSTENANEQQFQGNQMEQ